MQPSTTDLPPLPSLEALIGPDGNIPRGALSAQLRAAMAAAAANGGGEGGANAGGAFANAGQLLAALQGGRGAGGASAGGASSFPALGLLARSDQLASSLLGSGVGSAGGSSGGEGGGSSFGGGFGSGASDTASQSGDDLSAQIMAILNSTDDGGGEFADLEGLDTRDDEFSHTEPPPHAMLLPGKDLKILAWASPPYKLVSGSLPMLQALGARPDELTSGELTIDEIFGSSSVSRASDGLQSELEQLKDAMQEGRTFHIQRVSSSPRRPGSRLGTGGPPTLHFSLTAEPLHRPPGASDSSTGLVFIEAFPTPESAAYLASLQQVDENVTATPSTSSAMRGIADRDTQTLLDALQESGDEVAHLLEEATRPGQPVTLGSAAMGAAAAGASALMANPASAAALLTAGDALPRNYLVRKVLGEAGASDLIAASLAGGGGSTGDLGRSGSWTTLQEQQDLLRRGQQQAAGDVETPSLPLDTSADMEMADVMEDVDAFSVAGDEQGFELGNRASDHSGLASRSSAAGSSGASSVLGGKQPSLQGSFVSDSSSRMGVPRQRSSDSDSGTSGSNTQSGHTASDGGSSREAGFSSMPSSHSTSPSRAVSHGSPHGSAQGRYGVWGGHDSEEPFSPARRLADSSQYGSESS